MTTLITGATGLIGSELVRRILTWDRSAQITLLVRPRGSRSAEARVHALLAELLPDPALAMQQVRVIPADLSSAGLGIDARTFDDLAASTRSIYHLGADVRFDQSLEAARATHVEATRHLADLAAAAMRRGEFQRFHHVSTFAAGRRPALTVIPEGPPVLTTRFRNAYEQTKAEAEALLIERADEFPLTIHRVGIVVGDSRTGWTSKFDVFYMLLRLTLELEPSTPTVHLPLPARALVNAVPIDFTADALYALGHLRRPASGEILHYTAGRRTTLVVDSLRMALDAHRVHLAARGEQPAAHVILEPIEHLSEDDVTEMLQREVPPLILDVMRQLIPYGFDDVVFDNQNLLNALEGTPLDPPSIAEIIGPLVDYPLRTNWGAPHEPRPPLGAPPV